VPVEFNLEIRRSVPNPEFDKPRPQYAAEIARYLELPSVTVVTLNEEQWRKVQAAIVEALK